MKAFISSALPWVLMGIALAILAANHCLERQKGEKQGERIALGAALGLMLGVALNGCGLWESHALGLAIGPLWGMALASMFRDGDSSGKQDSNQAS